jgi:hypothetical protein
MSRGFPRLESRKEIEKQRCFRELLSRKEKPAFKKERAAKYEEHLWLHLTRERQPFAEPFLKLSMNRISLGLSG